MRNWILLGAAAAIGIAAQPARGEWTRLAPSFTRVYEGEITDGKLPIRLTLTKRGREMTGSYYYTKQPRSKGSLRLKGTIDGTGAFILNESDAKGFRTGTFTGAFQGPTKLAGEWLKPGGVKDSGRYFFAYEAFTKPTDATGPFTGEWVLGRIGEDGSGFHMDLYQRGDKIEGFYHGVTRNATRLDTDSEVFGTVRGKTAHVTWTSGYSGASGKAQMKLVGRRLSWRITKSPSAEYWAPQEAMLRRD